MKNYLLCFGLIALIISCTDKDAKKDIVLKIGDLEVTRYTVEKKVAGYFPDPKMKTKEELEDFYTKLVDGYFLIADAYNKGYDTLDTIKNRLKYTVDISMIQHGGLLWDNLVGSRLYDSIQITPEKEAKRSKVFYYDVLYSNSKQKFVQELKNDTVMESYEEFTQWKKKCNELPFLFSTNYSMQWPFGYLHTYSNVLYSMKVGQVSPMITVDEGVFYFYLDTVETITLTEQDRNMLTMDLQQIAEESISKENDIKMLRSGDPVINEQSVQEVMAYIRSGNSITHFTGDPEVITYTIDGQRKSVRFKECIAPLVYYPSGIHVETESELRSSIMECFYRDYMIHEARQMGLYQSDRFAIDCKTMLDGYLYYEYINREIRDSVRVDSQEVRLKYAGNPDLYKAPVHLVFNCYFFDSEADAQSNWSTISDFYRNHSYNDIIDREQLRNLSYVSPNLKYNLQNIPDEEGEISKMLQATSVGQLSLPQHFRNKYVLFFRIGQEGEQILDLAAVYPSIENELFEAKADSLLQQRKKELRHKYKLEIDRIDVKKL